MATIDMFYPPLPTLLTGTPRARILAALEQGELHLQTIAFRCNLDMEECYKAMEGLLRDGLVGVRDDRRGYALYSRR